MATQVPDRPGRRRESGDLTVVEIAGLAGVSPATVSKVIHGRGGVGPSTRARVQTLLEQHRRRSPAVGPRSASLDVVFHRPEAQLAMAILRGVEPLARARGLVAGFVEAARAEPANRSWVDDVLTRRPTGVIAVHPRFAGDHEARLTASGIPVVALDPTGEPVQHIPSVGSANWSGGVAAARHLTELGHRRIAAVAGPAAALSARERLEAVRAALDTVGVPLDPALIRSGHFSFDDGLALGADLLDRPDPPTAIICGNDLQALGVYEAARRAGRRIPHELSVTGFDDLPYTGWCGPPLTSVRQPFTELGRAAAELVLTLAAGEPLERYRVELATTLVVRGSTAPPPSQTS